MLADMVVSSPRYATALLCLCTLTLLAAVQPVAAPAGPGKEQGHLVLVVEGDVTSLRIVRAVAKADDWGGTQKGLQSEFALRALDADGKDLISVPMDLSRFDTDPAHIGKQDQVNGCEVRSARVGLLLNIPRVDGVASYQFVRGKTAIGEATADAVAQLLSESR